MVRGEFTKTSTRGGTTRGLIPSFSMQQYNNRSNDGVFFPYRLRSRRLVAPTNRFQTVYMFPTRNIQRGRRTKFLRNVRQIPSHGMQVMQQPIVTNNSFQGGAGRFYNPGLYTAEEPLVVRKNFRRGRRQFNNNNNNNNNSMRSVNKSKNFSNNNNNNNKKQQARGNRRRNRRRNNRQRAPPNETDLNAQLDAYMGDDAAKSRLDSQLDSYFGRSLTPAEPGELKHNFGSEI